MKRRLEWLCQLARMSDQRAPKKEGALSLAGEDTPKMWTKKRDILKEEKDLLAANINFDNWYDMAHDRGEWYKVYTEGALNYQCTHHHCTEVREVRCDMYKDI